MKRKKKKKGGGGHGGGHGSPGVMRSEPEQLLTEEEIHRRVSGRYGKMGGHLGGMADTPKQKAARLRNIDKALAARGLVRKALRNDRPQDA